MTYKVERDFEHKGFRCVVVAQQAGHRCGYVQIPKNHPCFGKPYTIINEFLTVHGGLTYGSMKTTYPVNTDELSYWLGFDCAHCGDARDFDLMKELGYPLSHELFCNDGYLWTADDVSEELKMLVDQLALAEGNEM